MKFHVLIHCTTFFCITLHMIPGAIIALEPSIRPLLNRLAPEASSRIQNEAMLNRTTNGPYFRV
ncbi:unnamed protein product [Schistosoma rodhaini]|nr:unnamed protein product [Schistosoma rodhaini]